MPASTASAIASTATTTTSRSRWRACSIPRPACRSTSASWTPRCKAALLDRVDHYDLSATVPELDGVITTGENLARTFWQWLEPVLPAGRLRRVAVVETDNNVFEYCGDTIPAR